MYLGLRAADEHPARRRERLGVAHGSTAAGRAPAGALRMQRRRPGLAELPLRCQSSQRQESAGLWLRQAPKLTATRAWRRTSMAADMVRTERRNATREPGKPPQDWIN